MESFLEAWDLICDYCKKQVTDVSYETWFSKLVPISLDFGAGVAIIQAPNEFNKSTIERGFHKCLNDAVQSVFGEAFTYKLITPMEKKEKEESIKFLLEFYEKYILKNGFSEAISMYEFVTESAVNELGNMGEHEWAEEIDRRAIRASLQCRRVWDVHYKLYDILWNENEIMKKSGKRVSNDEMNTELKRCIMISHYVKRYFYENVYKEKIS